MVRIILQIMQVMQNTKKILVNNMLDKIKKLENIEGLGIIIFCGIVIMLGPIAKILAWLGLAYGAWKLWQGFKN